MSDGSCGGEGCDVPLRRIFLCCGGGCMRGVRLFWLMLDGGLEALTGFVVNFVVCWVERDGVPFGGSASFCLMVKGLGRMVSGGDGGVGVCRFLSCVGVLWARVLEVGGVGGPGPEGEPPLGTRQALHSSRQSLQYASICRRMSGSEMSLWVSLRLQPVKHTPRMCQRGHMLTPFTDGRLSMCLSAKTLR